MKKPDIAALSADRLVRLIAAGIMALAIKYLYDVSRKLEDVSHRLDTLQMRLDDHDMLGSDLALRLKRLEGEIFYP